ncbi:NUDIX hydrolase [Tropicimonas sp. IMCC34011]|uniref:NUDIX hydrolase n=1 Tax=Tropicimonas sp. IMCC34011 TaxID=2248759 RepID=UPI000E26ACD7|nr:NUDIX hydrolase [Tropicimonas sp. IMCC34011]
MLRTIWTDYIAPILKRPAQFQVAALCHRPGAAGREILLITSRETRRWILPKGWPKSGLGGGETAAEEAWEEAGVRALPGTRRRIGRYSYSKTLPGGLPMRTEVDVYAIEVDHLEDEFPEEGQRERRWVLPEQASRMVTEPELKAILAAFPSQIEPGGPSS